MDEKKIVTRFAPSPTGFMHVGSARTALFAYIFAKQSKGEFILRIEDTDKAREVDGAVEQIKESLRFVLCNGDVSDPWDKMYIQSERLGTYKDWAKKLLESGFAYFDPYTKEELENFRVLSENQKKPFLFREHRPNNLDTTWDEDKLSKMPIRFKSPEPKKTLWVDVVRGELSAGAESQDDFIILKTDGFPTYNFCHIVDDILMEVTHVMRGEEFIPSTPKFISLYNALKIVFPDKKIKIPVFVTLPPILGETGTKKLSKRDGAKDVLDYKKDGFLASALVNFLVLQGWNPGGEREIFKLEDLIEIFTLEKIQKSGARWSEEKLLWLNKEHIKLLTPKEQFNIVKKSLPNSLVTTDDKLARVLPHIIERIQVASDIKKLFDEGEFIYFFETPKNISVETLNWKKDPNSENTKRRLSIVEKLLSETDRSFFEEPQHIKKILMEVTEIEGKGEVLWPLRMALSGREKSSDPFTIISIIGKDETLLRINAVMK